jgi:hypothetical protein
MEPTDPKTAKKLAKARLKAAKKREAAGRADAAAEGAPGARTASDLPPAGATPAERAAAAAERQVRLQRLRVLIALGAVVVALLTLLVTTRPWTWGEKAGGTPRPQPLTSPSTAQPLVPPPPPGAGRGTTALTWTVPAGWMPETPSTPTRKAQYRIPGAGGDASCVVFYFGPGQGGGAMANAQRWASQFTLADGRPGTAGMKTASRKVGDIEVLTVEVAGTYQGGFMMQRRKTAPKPGQQLLGAIAKGPDANWFFKLTGPAATVEKQRVAFEGLVGSLERAAAGSLI